MKISSISRLLGAVGALFLTTALSAQITGISGSTSAPPATLGGYTMTAFGTDPQPLFSNTLNVVSPLGGLLSFSSGLTHSKIGVGWATWSHGYKGDVYMTGDTFVTFTLPTDTYAFYFYAEPDLFDVYNITATAGVTMLSESVHGSYGAKFFGFFTDGSVALSTISITTTDDTGFAVGEFGIARGPSLAAAITPVPEPSTYALAGAAALVGIVLLRRKQKK